MPLALLIPIGWAVPTPASADGLVVFGTREVGGGTNAFQKIIDLANGRERTTEIHGQSSSEEGFDTQPWNFLSGAGNTIDMPSQVADDRAARWIDQAGWRAVGKKGEWHRRVTLPNASPIDLSFDLVTRQIRTATIEGDYGSVSFKFGDWRRVGRYIYPFRWERNGDVDGRQIDQVQSVRLVAHVDENLLKRPEEGAVAQLREDVTVPIKSIGRQKTHISISAAINGTPTEFVFDTGAANILTIDAAKRLGIAAAGGIAVGGVGEGNENGGFGLVRRLAVGAASLDDQSFMIIPSPFPASNGKPSELAGLVGYELLAHFVTTIDYRSETLTLRNSVPSNQRGVRVPFVSDGHLIAIKVGVNGKPVLVRFDTGDGGTLTLFPAYLTTSGLEGGEGPVRVTGGGAGGDIKARAGRIDRLNVGGVVFPNLTVQFSVNSRGAFASRHLAGNLGAAVIRCFRVTFNYRHHELWLEPHRDTHGCIAGAKLTGAS